jgi:hypothetical protein
VLSLTWKPDPLIIDLTGKPDLHNAKYVGL